MELIFNSLLFATVATVLSFFLGILAAEIVSLKKLRALDIIFTLPMVLPPSVVGFLLLILFGNRGPFSGIYNLFGIQILFTPIANIIAATFVSFPLMYRSAYAAFNSVEKDYISVSKTLGMSNFKIFRKIVLPLSKRGIVSGTILSFSRSIGEFGATMMVSGNIPGRTQTLSTAIYTAVQSGNYQRAYVLVFIVVLISTILLLLSTGDERWL